jgi:Flp pilus assembly pilin Flp
MSVISILETEGMRRLLKARQLQDSAATAIEYAMIAFLVSIAGFVLYSKIGTGVAGLFQNVANSF